MAKLGNIKSHVRLRGRKLRKMPKAILHSLLGLKLLKHLTLRLEVWAPNMYP